MKLVADYQGDDTLVPQYMLGYLFDFLKASDRTSQYQLKMERSQYILNKSSAKNPNKFIVAMGFDIPTQQFFTNMTSSPLVLDLQFIKRLKPLINVKFDTELQSAMIESWRILRFVPNNLSEKNRPLLPDLGSSNSVLFQTPAPKQTVSGYFSDLCQEHSGLGFLELHSGNNPSFLQALAPVLAQQNVKHFYIELPFNHLYAFEHFNQSPDGDLSLLENSGMTIGNIANLRVILKALHLAGIQVYPIDRYFAPSDTENMTPAELVNYFVIERNKILIGSVKHFTNLLEPHERYACLLGVAHYPVLGTKALNIPHIILDSKALDEINPDDFIHQTNKELFGAVDFDLSTFYRENFYLDITEANDEQFLHRPMESITRYHECPDWLPQSNTPESTSKSKVAC